MILFAIVSEAFPRSASSVVATLVHSARKITKRSRYSVDEASKSEARHQNLFQKERKLSLWLQGDTKKNRH